MIYKTNNKKGFTLIETIIYIGGVVLIVGIIADMLFYAYSWYGNLSAKSRVDAVGIALVDRLIDDVRSGQDINASQSLFGANSGVLSMIVLTAPSVTVTKRYSIEGDRLAFSENSGPKQYLTPDDLTVSQFRLNQLLSPVGKAVRFVIDISYLTKSGTTTSTYTGMAILRNSYQ
jgi:type II secretory pathway pseudopilin PulG